MALNGERGAPETRSDLDRLRIRTIRDDDTQVITHVVCRSAAAQRRRRVDEAALGAAVRELRTCRRPGVRA